MIHKINTLAIVRATVAVKSVSYFHNSELNEVILVLTYIRRLSRLLASGSDLFLLSDSDLVPKYMNELHRHVMDPLRHRVARAHQ